MALGLVWWWIGLMGGVAQAGSSAELVRVAVPASPPENHAAGVPLTYSRAVAKRDSWSDGVAPSNQAQVQCRVTEGVLFVDFSASDADWPSLPLRGRCRVEGSFYRFRVEAMNPDLDPSSWQVEVDEGQAVAIRKRAGSAWLQSFLLPPTPDFEEGEVASSLAGTVCRVSVDAASGSRFVSVKSLEAADVGAGTCELPVASGSYTLSLDISAVDSWW